MRRDPESQSGEVHSGANPESGNWNPESSRPGTNGVGTLNPESGNWNPESGILDSNPELWIRIRNAGFESGVWKLEFRILCSNLQIWTQSRNARISIGIQNPGLESGVWQLECCTLSMHGMLPWKEYFKPCLCSRMSVNH